MGVLLLYGRAIGHGFVHDDHELLEHSRRLADLGTLPTALGEDLFWLADGAVRPSPYWRPVVVLSYYLDRQVGQGAAWSFHLSNLIYLALLGWAAGRDLGPRVRVAALTLLLAHPMMSEVALNITARTDLLAALFGLLALRSAGGRAALLTLLALGSKEVAIVVPLMAAGGAWLEGDRRISRWLPHALAVAGWAVVRTALVSTWGVASEDRGLPTAASALEAPARIGFYVSRMLWPLDPVAARQLPELSQTQVALGWAGLALALLLVARRRSREALHAGLPLVPVSGLLASPVRYAEGFLCWPLVGLTRGLAQASPALTLALAVPCAVLTWDRVQDWRDEPTLWAEARADYPEDPLIAGKFGVSVRSEDPAAAEAALRQGVEGVRDPRLRREWGAHLAAALIDADRWREALPYLRAAARPDDPEASWALMARCTVEAGERLPSDPSAPPLSEVCAEATRRSPNDADLWNAAGVEAASRGDLPAALERFTSAAALAPDREDIRNNLALARSLQGAAP